MTDKFEYKPRPAVQQDPFDFRDRFVDFDHLYQVLVEAGKDLEIKLNALKAAFQKHDYEEALRVAATLVHEHYEPNTRN